MFSKNIKIHSYLLNRYFTMQFYNTNSIQHIINKVFSYKHSMVIQIWKKIDYYLLIGRDALRGVCI